MAELTISAADIEGAVEQYVSSFAADTEREEIGTVIDAGDGIAHVEGLPSVMAQELLEFPGGVYGMAFNLEEDNVGVVPHPAMPVTPTNTGRGNFQNDA